MLHGPQGHILLVWFVLLSVASGAVFMKQRDQISQDEISLQILKDKITQMEAAYEMEKIKTDSISAKVATLGEEEKRRLFEEIKRKKRRMIRRKLGRKFKIG